MLARMDPLEVDTLLDAGQEMMRLVGDAQRAMGMQLPVEEDGLFEGPDNRRYRPLVAGSTPDDRRRQFVEQCMRGVAAFADDPWRWSFQPTDDVVALLGDPLQPETRSARRNLLLFAAVVLLVAVTGRAPENIPGIEFKLAGLGPLVMTVLGVVLFYELVAFSVYAWNDSRKNHDAFVRANGKIAILKDHAALLRSVGGRILRLCPDGEVRERAAAALGHFRTMVPIVAIERREGRWPARLRRWIDLLLPGGFALLALVLLVVRILGRFDLWPFALLLPTLSLGYFAWGPLRSGWHRQVRRRYAIWRARRRGAAPIEDTDAD